MPPPPWAAGAARTGGWSGGSGSGGWSGGSGHHRDTVNQMLIWK